jgi:hypothetical protein
MDTELARTFLTVVTAGNFITAAERLHVSQSTVSTRIHAVRSQQGRYYTDSGGAAIPAPRLGAGADRRTGAP